MKKIVTDMELIKGDECFDIVICDKIYYIKHKGQLYRIFKLYSTKEIYVAFLTDIQEIKGVKYNYFVTEIDYNRVDYLTLNYLLEFETENIKIDITDNRGVVIIDDIQFNFENISYFNANLINDVTLETNNAASKNYLLVFKNNIYYLYHDNKIQRILNDEILGQIFYLTELEYHLGIRFKNVNIILSGSKYECLTKYNELINIYN